MEITSKNFWASFPEVVEAIVSSTYVSLDLEMTGIFTKTGVPLSRPSLQDVYEQAKEAAERFQIVQCGLTCITYDEPLKEYHARTFTFLLTPSFTGKQFVDHQLAKVLDRYIGFSQSSIMFLRDHGFHMDRAFECGVSYLSRAEIDELRKTFLTPIGWLDPTERINIGGFDQQAIDFYNYALKIIQDWFTDKSREWEFVNIPNPHGGRLNSLQVRMIQEIITDQYPTLRTHPRNNRSFMQVVIRDKVEDAELAAHGIAKKVGAMQRQQGFTFVIQALMGIDFTHELPIEHLVTEQGPRRGEEINVMRARMARLERKLKKEQPIFIGHNSFYDLAFIYQTFFGPLPDNIEDFALEMSYLLPRFVDTKYLGKRPGNHSMLSDDTLTELYQLARRYPRPKILADSGLPNVSRDPYPSDIQAHQAGFDSWMTAVVFLRFAWALGEKAVVYKAPTEAELARAQAEKDEYSTALKEIGEAIAKIDFSDANKRWKERAEFEEQKQEAMNQPSSDPELTALIDQFPAPPPLSYGTMDYNSSWLLSEDNDSPPTLEGQWQTDEPSLLDATDAGVPGWEPLIPSGAASPYPDLETLMNEKALKEGLATDSEVNNPAGKILDWDSEFWRTYGNKLRVGIAGVLDLDKYSGMVRQVRSD